jgi:hypothetical protein
MYCEQWVSPRTRARAIREPWYWHHGDDIERFLGAFGALIKRLKQSRKVAA